MYWHLDEGSSVQFSHAVMSNSLWPHGHQASLSITNSQSLLKLMSTSRWCHPAIPSSVVPFSCFQSFPASESFPVSQFFTSVRVASNLPDPREWLVILSTGESCLAASGFWSCFGFFPSVWPVSTSASPLVQKTILLSTVTFHCTRLEELVRNSLSLCPLWALWVQETRFWGLWQNSDFGTFRNPAKITSQVRVTTIQMQMRPVPGSQTHRRSASHSTQIASAIAFMFLTL